MAYAGWEILLDVGWAWTISSCYRLTFSSETWLWIYGDEKISMQSLQSPNVMFGSGQKFGVSSC